MRSSAIRVLALVTVAILAALAFATTTVDAQVTALLKIHNEGDAAAQDLSINLANWVTFNETTGMFALVPPGTPLSASWEWAQNETIPVPGAVDAAKDPLFETRPAVLHWVNTDRTDLSVMNIAGDSDPVMTYSFAVKNTTLVTQTYTFTLGGPIAPPITGAYKVYADVGVSLTNDETITPDATIAPVSLALKFQKLQLSDDNGATSFNPNSAVQFDHGLHRYHGYSRLRPYISVQGAHR